MILVEIYLIYLFKQLNVFDKHDETYYKKCSAM